MASIPPDPVSGNVTFVTAVPAGAAVLVGQLEGVGVAVVGGVVAVVIGATDVGVAVAGDVVMGVGVVSAGIVDVGVMVAGGPAIGPTGVDVATLGAVAVGVDGLDTTGVDVAGACLTGVDVAAGVSGVAVESTGVEVGVGVSVGAGVEVGVDVGSSICVVQPALETSFVSIVTEPLRARARPTTSAPVSNVMLVSARMFPWNDVLVPSVAELPTCQNTLHSDPPMITTDESLAVVSVLTI